MIQKVPIVFAADMNYMKYCAVAIKSIIRNASADKKYYIYVLCKNILKSVEERMKSAAPDNIVIDFVDVSGMLDERLLFVDGHVTKETYYRILIPEILSQWKKVIYLDVDLICNRDVADLLDVDMNNKLLAGVITVGNENRKEYTQNFLGIPHETYINAGVLVMHNEEIIRRFGRGGFVDACCGFLREKRKLKWHDQDLLNVLCFPDIFYLDERWNTTPLRIMRVKSKQIAEITKADIDDTYIFHYATNKPWERSLMELNFPFWLNAYDSAFFDEIMSDYMRIADTKVHFETMCNDGCISLAFLMKCLYGTVISRVKQFDRSGKKGD